MGRRGENVIGARGVPPEVDTRADVAARDEHRRRDAEALERRLDLVEEAAVAVVEGQRHAAVDRLSAGGGIDEALERDRPKVLRERLEMLDEELGRQEEIPRVERRFRHAVVAEHHRRSGGH